METLIVFLLRVPLPSAAVVPQRIILPLNPTAMPTEKQLSSFPKEVIHESQAPVSFEDVNESGVLEFGSNPVAP